jgi:hypothetical protein
MVEEYVSDVMREPQRHEGYQWGTVWLYRTAMPHGARVTPETDLTPLIVDQRGILLGWGRDLLSEHIKRYEELQGMGVSAERAISVADGGKGHGESTQLTTFYKAVEGSRLLWESLGQ